MLFFNGPDWLKWVLSHSDAIVGVVGTCLVFFLAKLVGHRKKKIYEQPKETADFKDYGSRTFTKDGPTGAAGEGRVRILNDGIIEINRTNIDGRWILQFLRFRLDGNQYLDYIPARREAGSQRSFIVSLEARAIGSSHTLRVAFRSRPKEDFIQDAHILVEPDVWQKFGRLMVPRADKDMYFFLESPAQTALSSVHVRKLVLHEELPGLRFDWLIELLNKLLGRRERSPSD